MIHVSDTIEGSGYPLGFCFRREGSRTGPLAGSVGAANLRVDARAMGGHQKEALVLEGDPGPAWRLVSDEGPILKGSDMAPFPLGFFNAGLQADLLGQVARLVGSRALAVTGVELELDNTYSFSGSFFKGDGQGTALPAQIRLEPHGSLSALAARDLVRDAVAASPALAAMTTPLANTFALYVNGIRREVTEALPSTSPDAPDPLKSYRTPPCPLADGKDMAGITTKIPMPPVKTEMMPSAGAKVEIGILGHSRLTDIARGLTAMHTQLKARPGNHFGLESDELSIANPAAPSGLALLAAGVSFCYMTQLLRYAQYLKYKVRAIRMVQYSPFGAHASPGGAQVGTVGPFDTHLFLHGDEPDAVMQRLLVMGARTCYLHAALHAALPPQVEARLNGAPLELS